MLTEDEQLELALKASLGGDSVQDLANEIINVVDDDDVVEITADPTPDTNDPTTGNLNSTIRLSFTQSSLFLWM